MAAGRASLLAQGLAAFLAAAVRPDDADAVLVAAEDAPLPLVVGALGSVRFLFGRASVAGRFFGGRILGVLGVAFTPLVPGSLPGDNPVVCQAALLAASVVAAKPLLPMNSGCTAPVRIASRHLVAVVLPKEPTTAVTQVRLITRDRCSLAARARKGVPRTQTPWRSCFLPRGVCSRAGKSLKRYLMASGPGFPRRPGNRPGRSGSGPRRAGSRCGRSPRRAAGPGVRPGKGPRRGRRG